MRVHCCRQLITRLPQLGHFFSLLWDTFILLVSVVFPTRNVGAGTQRVFANKRAVENCANIYIFEVGEVCDMSIISAIFFYTEACDKLPFASCWSCRTARANSV